MTSTRHSQWERMGRQLTFDFLFSFSVMREDAVTLRLFALCKSDAGSRLPSEREALS